jgi:multicomponent Na+:H+ antiporter subunit G
MIEIIASVLLVIGASFMFLAALGLLRMPDLMTRMHATTKAGVLGAGVMLIGVALLFGSIEVKARVLAIIAFVLITAPVAAHAIGRASYFVGVPLWRHTVRDDCRGRYDWDQHTLASSDVEPNRDGAVDGERSVKD